MKLASLSLRRTLPLASNNNNNNNCNKTTVFVCKHKYVLGPTQTHFSPKENNHCQNYFKKSLIIYNPVTVSLQPMYLKLV